MFGLAVARLATAFLGARVVDVLVYLMIVFLIKMRLGLYQATLLCRLIDSFDVGAVLVKQVGIGYVRTARCQTMIAQEVTTLLIVVRLGWSRDHEIATLDFGLGAAHR